MTIKNEPMTDQRLTLLMEAYGADATLWPEQDRTAALAHIERTSAARASLEEARSLDWLLSFGDDTPPVAPDLRQAVLSIRQGGVTQSTGFTTRLGEMFTIFPLMGWRGAVAATALILIGAAITLTNMTGDQQTDIDTAAAGAAIAPVIVTARLENGDGVGFALSETVPFGVGALSLTGEVPANAGEFADRLERDRGSDSEPEIPMI